MIAPRQVMDDGKLLKAMVYEAHHEFSNVSGVAFRQVSSYIMLTRKGGIGEPCKELFHYTKS